MKTIIPVIALLTIGGCVGGSRDDRPPQVQAAASAAPAIAGTSQDDEARAAYLRDVQLRALRAEPFETREKERKAVVSGEIKNTGQRTLSEVQVTIYFLDNNGKAVHEQQTHPVLESGFGMIDTGPLRPNYTRKWSGGYDVPSDWAGKVTAKVTDVKFAIGKS